MSDTSKLSSNFFVVELDGIQTMRFQKCEGLEAESEVFELEEGGGEIHHFDGQTRFPNLILEKGINDNNFLLEWFQSITNPDKKVERKNGSVILMNTAGKEIKRWNFFRAFPVRWIGPKLEACRGVSFPVERVEIAHEGIEVDSNSEVVDFHLGKDMSRESYFFDGFSVQVVDSFEDDKKTVVPAEGRISSEFGKRDSIQTIKGKTKEEHGGIDIANKEGTPIVAAMDGKILENTASEDYGNYVIITSPPEKGWNGTLTYYCHLKEKSKYSVGTIVKKGTQIGKMGHTGKSAGDHLHFEVRTNYGTTKHNPRDYVDFGDKK